jgi:hypothetical protein
MRTTRWKTQRNWVTSIAGRRKEHTRGISGEREGDNSPERASPTIAYPFRHILDLLFMDSNESGQH